MTDESCFRKELREDLVENHFEDNKSKFLKAVENIMKANLQDSVKIEMIENRLITYKEKMKYSIDLFC